MPTLYADIMNLDPDCNDSTEEIPDVCPESGGLITLRGKKIHCENCGILTVRKIRVQEKKDTEMDQFLEQL